MRDAFTQVADFPITQDFKDALAVIKPMLRIRTEGDFHAFISGEKIQSTIGKLIAAFPEIEGWERARFTDNVKLLLEDVQAEHELKFYECAHHETKLHAKIPVFAWDDLKTDLRDSLKGAAINIALLTETFKVEKPQTQRQLQEAPAGLIYVI